MKIIKKYGDMSKCQKFTFYFITSKLVMFLISLTLFLFIRRKVKAKPNSILDFECPAPEVYNDEIDVEKEKSDLMFVYGNRPYVIKPSIFVAISSYRDSELCNTIEDLCKKALVPARVFFGILEQNDPDDQAQCFAKNAKNVDASNISIQSIHWRDAKGPTWARHLCEKLWKGETYHLMCDSHMLAEPGWDVQLIEMLNKLPCPRRCIISCYPEGYERIQEGFQVRRKILMRRGFRKQQFNHFNEQQIPEFESVTTHDRPPFTPPLGNMWGACFHFSHSDTIRLCPFSPETPYLFFGEEIFMNARYWTHGFDIFLPTHSVIYHLWRRDHRKTFWNESDNITIRDQSIQHIKEIMLGIKHSEYGLGTCRTAREFWNYVGLDLPNQEKLTDPAKWEPPVGFSLMFNRYCKKCR